MSRGRLFDEKDITMKSKLIASLFIAATPAIAHPDPTVAACLDFADLARSVAIARDDGYDEADVLNVLIKSGLFDKSPGLSYRVVREVFESQYGPEEIREAGFMSCMDALRDGD